MRGDTLMIAAVTKLTKNAARPADQTASSRQCVLLCPSATGIVSEGSMMCACPAKGEVVVLE